MHWDYFSLPVRQSLFCFSGAVKFYLVHGLIQLTWDSNCNISLLQTSRTRLMVNFLYDIIYQPSGFDFSICTGDWWQILCICQKDRNAQLEPLKLFPCAWIESCISCRRSSASENMPKLEAGMVREISVYTYFDEKLIASTDFSKVSLYSRTSMARTPLGPWKLVRDRGSSSEWKLIIALGQEA